MKHAPLGSGQVPRPKVNLLSLINIANHASTLPQGFWRRLALGAGQLAMPGLNAIRLGDSETLSMVVVPLLLLAILGWVPFATWKLAHHLRLKRDYAFLIALFAWFPWLFLVKAALAELRQPGAYGFLQGAALLVRFLDGAFLPFGPPPARLRPAPWSLLPHAAFGLLVYGALQLRAHEIHGVWEWVHFTYSLGALYGSILGLAAVLWRLVPLHPNQDAAAAQLVAELTLYVLVSYSFFVSSDGSSTPVTALAVFPLGLITGLFLRHRTPWAAV